MWRSTSMKRKTVWNVIIWKANGDEVFRVFVQKPDFTNTFCNLMNYDHAYDEEFEDDEFNNWKIEWKKRID